MAKSTLPVDESADEARELEELRTESEAKGLARAADPSVCAVDDGRCVGRAVNGKVCSYHAMTYRSDGTKRST